MGSCTVLCKYANEAQHFTKNYIFAILSSDLSTNNFHHGHDTYIDYGSCVTIVGNHAIVFGGNVEKSQVSVIYPGGVKRIQSLPFQLQNGRCHHDDGTIYLCLPNKCYKTYDLMKYDEMEETKYNHMEGGIVTINKELVAIAGIFTAAVEVFNGALWNDTDAVF